MLEGVVHLSAHVEVLGLVVAPEEEHLQLLPCSATLPLQNHAWDMPVGIYGRCFPKGRLQGGH